MGIKDKAELEYATALKNATRRGERLVQVLSILREMDQLDDPVRGLKNVCCQVVQALSSSLAAENCSLFLLNEPKGEVQLRATCSPLEEGARYLHPEDRQARKFKLGEGIVGAVAAGCKPLRVEDTRLDSRFVVVKKRRSAPRSLLCFPLMVEQRLVGVLNLSHSAPGFFTPESEHLLSFVADRAARMFANHLVHERLRQSEDFYRLILETADDAVLVLDQDGRVSSANAAVGTLTGIPPQDFIEGRANWHSVVFGEDLEEFLGHLKRLLAEKTPAAVQYRCVDAGGGVHALEQRSAPVCGLEGEVQGIVCIARDVTERNLAQEQLLQAQKMESVGRLAGGVAHDFNNLLTVISGYAEVLHSQLETAPEALDRLGQIEEAAERAAQLVRQLLAFSRKQVVQPKVIDLNHSLQDTGKMLRRVLGDDIELVANWCEEPAFVLIDPVHLTQVLMNLAVNARDAMEGGGTLKLESSVVEIGSDLACEDVSPGPGAYACIKVEDSGCGMTDETRARIFEPFFTTKLDGAGTGLGLATVRSIVAQNGGFTKVETEPGTGTTFYVFLPLVSVEDKPAAAPPNKVPKRGTETVLAVEDERAVRRLIVQMLTRQGYKVLEAPSAEAAMALVEEREETIDLVLTDFLMPQMNGLDLARRLTADRPGLKVLVMSGYAGQSASDEALQESGFELVQKPFTAPELTGRIREVLDAR